MTTNPDRQSEPATYLARLSAHLTAHGYTTGLTTHDLRVRNRGADEQTAVLITCARRPDDSGTWWFFTDGKPLASADRVADAVVEVKSLLAEGGVSWV